MIQSGSSASLVDSHEVSSGADSIYFHAVRADHPEVERIAVCGHPLRNTPPLIPERLGAVRDFEQLSRLVEDCCPECMALLDIDEVEGLRNVRPRIPASRMRRWLPRGAALVAAGGAFIGLLRFVLTLVGGT